MNIKDLQDKLKEVELELVKKTNRVLYLFDRTKDLHKQLLEVVVHEDRMSIYDRIEAVHLQICDLNKETADLIPVATKLKSDLILLEFSEDRRISAQEEFEYQDEESDELDFEDEARSYVYYADEDGYAFDSEVWYAKQIAKEENKLKARKEIGRMRRMLERRNDSKRL